MTPSRGVLFDVGHTLMSEDARLQGGLARLAARLSTANEGFDAAELAARYEEACKRPRAGAPSLIVQMLTDLGLSREEAERHRSEMDWDRVPLDPKPDAAASLARLREAGLRVGVLANQPASAEEDLRRSGLLDLLDGVWLSEAVGLAKPDPAFFRLALEAWAMEPSDVAYVGDRPDNDVGPARALGLFAVRVRQGPHAAQEPRSPGEEADADAADLGQAVDALLRWAGAA